MIRHFPPTAIVVSLNPQIGHNKKSAPGFALRICQMRTQRPRKYTGETLFMALLEGFLFIYLFFSLPGAVIENMSKSEGL